MFDENRVKSEFDSLSCFIFGNISSEKDTHRHSILLPIVDFGTFELLA